MRTVGIVQARMSSERLPGKVMLPLDGEHVITHVVRRVKEARNVDSVVLATSNAVADDILERYADRLEAVVHRGSERDVLGRVYEAGVAEDAEVIVRITGDCPLVDPGCIDAVVDALRGSGADYSSNVLDRTFPRGLDVEAFTMETFHDVERLAETAREHVTTYYRSHPDKFDLANVTSDGVFDADFLLDRTDLRLTLDEADDYELLREVYRLSDYDHVLPIERAVRVIDEHGLSALNDHVEQKAS